MVMASYLPWLTGGQDTGSLSGMDLYDLRQTAGENPFMVDEMFKANFDPFVTGAVTVALGALVAVLALAMLLLPKRPPPSRFRVNPGLYFVAIILLLLAFLAVFLNVLSFVTRPDGIAVSLGIGLLLAAAGMVAGWVGVLMAGAATKADMVAGAAGPPAVTAPTAGQPLGPPPGPQRPVAAASQPAGWYPDPHRRHDVRHWDGRAWTSHVSDRGTPGEDPV